MTLTRDRLFDLLTYSPDTGLFYWKVTRRAGAKAGSRAGTPDKDGYTHIKIDGRLYKAHRLAWFYMTGEWPKDQIDHINRERDDNRWGNLREATRSQNMANARCRGAVPAKGVGFDKRRSVYTAIVQKDGQRHRLGTFKNINDAAEAYRQAATRLYGQFAGGSIHDRI